jgi:hypothetical protein
MEGHILLEARRQERAPSQPYLFTGRPSVEGRTPSHAG